MLIYKERFKEENIMFGKGKKQSVNAGADVERMIKALDNIIAGDFNKIDVSEYEDTKYGEKVNALIDTFKKANNNFIMRLNDAMESIGDNSYVKKTQDQVMSQTEALSNMKSASSNMESSIGDITSSMAQIRDKTHEVINVAKNSTDTLNDSIKVVNESSDRIMYINNQVQEFNVKIDKISEIVDIVKKVASQSNLLALNASIEAARAGEAGKGFAVVADQVRELSSNTSDSAEDIVRYVSELRDDINALASDMNSTTEKLSEGNNKVEASLDEIEKMNAQLVDIDDNIENIFTAIDVQSDLTKDFTKQTETISESYKNLSDDCSSMGTHIYKIGRYIDTARSDMVRGFAEITELDWLRVFEVDHFILMWRVYNNAADYERLKVTQLNNPTGCKLGKWMAAQTDKGITESQEFAELKKAHEDVHKYATLSWEARDKDDIKGAYDYFDKTYDAYFVYQKAIRNMGKRMRQLGYTDKTDIVVFRN